jgi:putative flavoprotein involved in K+ transport
MITQDELSTSGSTKNYDTIVIGGGQAGLAAGYYLRQRGIDFVILDASERIGDSWRKRWDSLRLFTPAWHNGLPGMPFPAPARYYPTKDEMAGYLEAYAAQFALPVRTGVRVTRVSKESGSFIVASDGQRFQADSVVVAMSNYQVPKTPAFANDLDPAIVQLHSSQYRSPSQLRDGDVLVIGAGNSGAEIALEVANGRRTWLSGISPGHVPFRIESFFGRHIGVPLVMFAFRRIMTLNTPAGRKMRPKLRHHSGPLVRTKPGDLVSAGVEFVPRVAGVHGGLPVLEGGRVLEAANVIWCTGFRPDFSWIELPVFQEDGYPREERGVVPAAPGLFFVGLAFQQAASSTLIGGVGRDAEYISRQVAARPAAQARAQAPGEPHLA